MVQRNIRILAAGFNTLSMTEVGMNDYDIDPDVFAAHVREAQRTRSEAIRALFVMLWVKLAGLGASIGGLARSLGRRRKWNLSVPAPHR